MSLVGQRLREALEADDSKRLVRLCKELDKNLVLKAGGYKNAPELEMSVAHHLANKTYGLECLKVLVTKIGPNCLKCTDSHGDTPVHMIALNQSEDWIEWVNKTLGPSCFEMKGQFQQNPVHRAAQNTRSNSALACMVRMCGGACLTAQDEYTNMPIHYAAWKQGLESMELIKKSVGNRYFDQRGQCGRTTFHWAAMNEGSHEVLKWLVKECGENGLAMFDDHGNLPIHLAALFQSADSIQFIVDKMGSHVLTAKADKGATVVQMAAKNPNSNSALARCVARLGPSCLLDRDSRGQTPAHLAAQYQGVDSLRLIAQSLGVSAFTSLRDWKGFCVTDYVQQNKDKSRLLSWIAEQQASLQRLPQNQRQLDECMLQNLMLKSGIQQQQQPPIQQPHIVPVGLAYHVPQPYLPNQPPRLYQQPFQYQAAQGQQMAALQSYQQLPTQQFQPQPQLPYSAYPSAQQPIQTYPIQPVQMYPAQPQTFQAQPQTLQAQPQVFQAQSQAFQAQPQAFQAQPQAFQAQPQTLQAQPQVFQAQPQTLQAQPQAFQAQPLAFQAQPQAFQAQPQAFQAQPQNQLVRTPSLIRTPSTEPETSIQETAEEPRKFFEVNLDPVADETPGFQPSQAQVPGKLDPNFTKWEFLLDKGKRQQIGKGGFGTVYKAITDRHQTVAVKIVEVPESHNARETEAVKKIIETEENGINILRSIQHPNILLFLRSGRTEKGDFCIFTELIAGNSLFDRMKQQEKPFDESGVRKFSLDICSALNFLHCKQPPVLHRDIKCQNIMLTNEGVVKLIDFGLAKELASTSQTTQLHGTWHFMAPEMFDDSIKEMYTPKTDVWAFGCTVFEMLTMEPPNNKLQQQQLPNAIREKDLPDLPPTVSPDLCDFYRRCVDRSSSQRPDTTELLQHGFLRNQYL